MLALLRSRGATLSDGPWSEDAARAFAPVFEARFRPVSRVVAEKGATKVLELAGRLSPRGMDLDRVRSDVLVPNLDRGRPRL